MRVKAAAFQEYNQAAVLDKLLTGMPEIVRAIAEPLSSAPTDINSSGSDAPSRKLNADRAWSSTYSLLIPQRAVYCNFRELSRDLQIFSGGERL